MAEDEMVRKHHQINGQEFEQTLGESGGERSLACCSPWSCRVRYGLSTEQQKVSYRHLASALQILYLILRATLQGTFYSPHIMDEKTEAKRG